MKLLKIFSAVLFFSFVGSLQNQLLAQGTKNIGYWARSLKLDEYLENGDYRAGFSTYGNSGNKVLTLTNKNTGEVIKNLILLYSSDTAVEIFEPEYGNYYFVTKGSGKGYSRYFELRKDFRKDEQSWYSKVLDKEVEVDKSAYFQLESDGRFVIYHGTVGLFGTAGTPIVELTGWKN